MERSCLSVIFYLTSEVTAPQHVCHLCDLYSDLLYYLFSSQLHQYFQSCDHV